MLQIEENRKRTEIIYEEKCVYITLKFNVVL